MGCIGERVRAVHLIARVHGQSAAWDIASTLNGKGIPTFVKQYSGSTGFGVTTYRIYVCLDRHVADAHAVLENPNHVVRDPVDVEAFNRDARGVDGRILKWGVRILAVVVAAMAAVLWLLDIPWFAA